MWEGRAVEADVAALVAPFGGVVNHFIFPTMQSDFARDDDAKIVDGGGVGADHSPVLTPDFSAEGAASAQPKSEQARTMKASRRRRGVNQSEDAASNAPALDAPEAGDVGAIEGPVPNATQEGGEPIGAVDGSGAQPQADSSCGNSQESPVHSDINRAADHDGAAPPAVASFPKKEEPVVEADVQQAGGDVGGNARAENPNLQEGDEAMHPAGKRHPNGG
jgi:hypothetical protein